MQFSDSTTEDGLIQEINRICATDDNNYSLKAKTARVNQALDRFFTIALMSDKSWLFDDTNNTNLPIAWRDIVSGRQDYTFPSELLVIKNVFAKDASGVYNELSEETTPLSTLTVPTGNSGVPTKFRVLSGSIMLDYIPNYNSTSGLKVYFARAASRFVSTDTTKVPGIPVLFHPWLAQVASLPFLIEKQSASKNDVAILVQQGEVAIRNFMANRNQTRKPRLGVTVEDNK